MAGGPPGVPGLSYFAPKSSRVKPLWCKGFTFWASLILWGRMVRRWPKPLIAEGISAIVFRTINASPTLWDAILPDQFLGLPPGLAEVDGLLDDPRLFEPFRPFFSARHDRPRCV